MNKITRLTLPCVIALLALAALFFVVDASVWASSPQPGTQAALTVTTLEDELNTDGDCSLREALTAANMNTPVDACGTGDAVLTDTISFSVAGTITVTSQLSVTAGGPLVVAGGGVITTSGGNTTRVWWVGAGSIVTLQGLGVVDGYLFNDNGAGLYNNGGNLIIIRSKFERNRFSVYGYWSSGGGIYSEGGLMGVYDSDFNANGSDSYYSSGGGIAISCTATVISRSTFDTNFSYGCWDIECWMPGGGAIWVRNASATIQRSTFIRNTSSGGGGGIASYFSELLMSNNLFKSNYGGRGGGGIFTIDGDLIVTDTVFADNTASNISGSGGAIYNNGSAIWVFSSTFVENDSGSAGGIFSHSGALTVVNSAISGNSADSLGGGLFINGGTATVTNSTFSRSHFKIRLTDHKIKATRQKAL